MYISLQVSIQAPFSRFEFGLKAEETRKKYVRRLEIFFDFHKVEGETIKEKAQNFFKFTKQNGVEGTTDLIINYMSFQIDRANKIIISKSTVRNFYKPIKLFCEMNNIILNWKIISKGIPFGTSSNDRIPTLEEIIEVLKYPDRRIKPIVYTMISSGIRVGAWDYLKWKHVIPIKNKDNLVAAAKLIVYEGEPEQYFSFITPEAYYSLKEWMEFREKQGEPITGNSYLMRDIWNTGKIVINAKESNLTKGTTGLISVPKQADSNAIRQIFTRAWKIQNIREVDNKRRHDFKSTHCFRKYFETHALKAMKLLNVKMLMGHDTGLEKSYYKPSEKELLDDYLKVVDILTVNKQIKLESKVNELAEKQDEIELMKLKHEKEMQAMDQKLDKVISMIQENPKLAKIKTQVLKKRIN
jgi:integrase